MEFETWKSIIYLLVITWLGFREIKMGKIMIRDNSPVLFPIGRIYLWWIRIRHGENEYQYMKEEILEGQNVKSLARNRIIIGRIIVLYEFIVIIFMVLIWLGIKE